jgi:uncharacterized protein YpmB
MRKLVSIILILIVSFLLAIKVYSTIESELSETKIEQLKKVQKEDYLKSVRFDLNLDDKAYYYRNIDDNTDGHINGQDEDLKYSSYFISNSSEYVNTQLNNKTIHLYCNAPIDKNSKDYIRSFGTNENIYVFPFDNNTTVFISVDSGKPAESPTCYILDLNNKTVIWTESKYFAHAYYRPSTNTVIATHNIRPTDSIWGKMEYEYYEVNISGEICKVETEN